MPVAALIGQSHGNDHVVARAGWNRLVASWAQIRLVGLVGLNAADGEFLGVPDRI